MFKDPERHKLNHIKPITRKLIFLSLSWTSLNSFNNAIADGSPQWLVCPFSSLSLYSFVYLLAVADEWSIAMHPPNPPAPIGSSVFSGPHASSGLFHKLTHKWSNSNPGSTLRKSLLSLPTHLVTKRPGGITAYFSRSYNLVDLLHPRARNKSHGRCSYNYCF